MTPEQLLRRVRILVVGFIVGLVLSGLTAFPLEWELNLLAGWLGAAPQSVPQDYSGFLEWIVRVRNALRDTNAQYPFLAYGYDWLAFGHLVIATAFIGLLRDPVRNKWLVDWALIACVAVFPLAFICGPIRGIPLYWQLIDCCFGVVGAVPLLLCQKYIGELEKTDTRFAKG
jgi:hypothetical protein